MKRGIKTMAFNESQSQSNKSVAKQTNNVSSPHVLCLYFTKCVHVFIFPARFSMLSVLFAACCCCLYNNRSACWSVTCKILTAITTAFSHRNFPCRNTEQQQQQQHHQWWQQFTQRVSKTSCLLVFGRLSHVRSLVLSPRDVHDAFLAIETVALLPFSEFVFISSGCVFMFLPSFALARRSGSLILSLGSHCHRRTSLFSSRVCHFFRGGMIYFPQLYYSRHLSTFHNTLPKMRSTS